MRNPLRIPIILDKIDLVQFIKDLKVFDIDEIINVSMVDVNKIREYWLKHPDLRLTQVLVGLEIIPNTLGFWFYTEETDYVVQKGILNFDEINYWGINYDKDNIKLPETIWKPLKELEIDHIRNILKWFDDNEGYINKSYRDYFEKRLRDDSWDSIKDQLSDL